MTSSDRLRWRMAGSAMFDEPGDSASRLVPFMPVLKLPEVEKECVGGRKYGKFMRHQHRNEGRHKHRAGSFAPCAQTRNQS